MIGDLLSLLLVTVPAWAFLLAVWLRQRRSQDSPGVDSFANIFCCALAFVGLLWFLGFGRIPWGSQDWRAFFAFFRTLHDSIRQARMPYYVIDNLADVERYFANLQAPLGPDVLLLGLLSVNAFYMVHVTLVFAVGCAGLLALRRELDLRPFTFGLLVALVVFNGHLTAHLSVGHAVWIEMLLVPWVFVALLRQEREASFRRNGVTLVLTLALLVADGAWHLFVASGLFIAAFSMSSRQRLWFGARVLLLLLPVIAYRLIPGIVTFGGGANQFRSGFPSARVMFDALTASWPSAALANQSMEWWEYDTYVGLPGLAIAVIGLWPFRDRQFRALDLMYWPALVLFALSCGDLYRHTLFRLPGLVSERVTTRFLIVPLLVFLLRGLVRLDRGVVRHLRERSLAAVVMLVAAWFIVGELLSEALMIRLPAVATPLPNPDLSHFIPPVEPGYVYSIWIGLLVSALGLIAVWGVARGRALPFKWTRTFDAASIAMRDPSGEYARTESHLSPLWTRRVGVLLILAGAIWPAVVGVLWLATGRSAPTVNVRWGTGVNNEQRVAAEKELTLVAYTQRDPRTLSYFVNDAEPAVLKRIVEHRLIEDTAFISRSTFVLEHAPEARRWIGHEKPVLARADFIYLSVLVSVAGIVVLVDLFGSTLAGAINPAVVGAVALVGFTFLGTSMPWLLSLPLNVNETPRAADAIVVLSGTFEPAASGPRRRRPDVDAALSLFQRGLATRIVFEATTARDLKILADMAMAGGVPQSAVSGIVAGGKIVEAVAAEQISLRKQNVHRILLVAAPLTMRRALNVWRTQIPWVIAVPIQTRQPPFYVHGGDGNIAQLRLVALEYRALLRSNGQVSD